MCINICRYTSVEIKKHDVCGVNYPLPHHCQSRSKSHEGARRTERAAGTGRLAHVARGAALLVGFGDEATASGDCFIE